MNSSNAVGSGSMGNRAVDVEHARAVLDRFNRRFDEAHRFGLDVICHGD